LGPPHSHSSPGVPGESCRLSPSHNSEKKKNILTYIAGLFIGLTGVDGICCVLTDKIDGELLNAAGFSLLSDREKKPKKEMGCGMGWGGMN